MQSLLSRPSATGAGGFQRLHQARSVPPRPAPRQPARSGVKANFFKFGKNGVKAQDAGMIGQGRKDFTADDVEHYFNYMGMLAVEGSYDRMEAMMKTGLEPIDVLLLMACQEDDAPRVEELLSAGAAVNIKDNTGKTPIELATKPEIVKMLKAKGAQAATKT